jgi:hypothetical protein
VGVGSNAAAASATSAAARRALAPQVAVTRVTVGGTTVSAEPSKCVSYLVTAIPTVAQKTAAPTVAWYGTLATSDSQGTLVDNGDGSHQYTFYRDPKQAAASMAGLTDSADGLSKKADLGDVSYDATLTHRLGNQPNMIHKIHMGKELVKQGYYFKAAAEGKFNDVTYPKRMCRRLVTPPAWVPIPLESAAEPARWRVQDRF